MSNNDLPIYKDGESFPETTRTPVVRVVDGSDTDSLAAALLLENNKDTIAQFVGRQRQAYALSPNKIHTSTYASPDVIIRYTNMYGSENVTVEPYPIYPTRRPPPTQPRPRVPAAPLVGLPPIPQPTTQGLCLVVLYNGPDGDNDVAIFDMGSLSPTSVSPPLDPITGDLIEPNIYSASQSDWGGKRIRVHQENFGSTGGVILTPIDFTPQSEAATTLNLWSTLLAGGAKTQTEAIQIPIMNGKDTTIYTPLDIFTFNNGAFARISDGGSPGIRTPNVDDPSEDFQAGMPYFVSPDGDYYCDPTWGLFFALGYSYPQGGGFYGPTAPPPAGYPDPAFKNFYAWTDAMVSAFPPSLPDALNTTVNEWGAPIIFAEETWTDNNFSGTVYTLVMNAIDIDLMTFRQIGTAGSFDNGSVAAANSSGEISFPSYAFQVQGIWYPDPTNPTETYIQGDASQTEFDGTIPYPQYITPTPSMGGADMLASVLVIVKASTDVLSLVYPGDGAAGGTKVLTAALDLQTLDTIPDYLTGLNVVNADPDPTMDGLLTIHGDGGTTGDPSDFGTGTVNAELKAIIEGWVGSDETYASDVEGDTWNAVWVVEAGWAWNTFVGQQVGALKCVSSQTSAFSGDDTSIDTQSAAAAPQLATYTGQTEDTNTPLSYEYDFNIFDFTPDYNTQTILAEPFPPSLNQAFGGDSSFFFSVETDNDEEDTFVSLDIHTPYGTFSGTKQTSFDPWLHVSNGAHWAQGFYVDDTPYLYLDGQDFFATLTAALNCQPSDIRAIFMDIPLGVAQGLSGITVTPPT